jgi:hypothetical protein
MFSPSSALPLPPRPSLEYYWKFAKGLVKACKSGSIDDCPDFARQALSEKCTLTNAQFVIARSHGFLSWPKFVRHLEGLAKNSPVARFEAAADAIINGDIETLQRLLREDPKLIRARSTREHGAMLLHYVAANGVEDYRQKTPKNIVVITEMLLSAGAEIDATANLYGGGSATLGLAATSIHPVRAGVLEELLQTLVDQGARIELASVTACLANARLKGAEFLVARGARLDLAAAAGMGRLDAVKDLFAQASAQQRNEGFIYACGYGRNRVVEFLLEKDAGLVTQSANGQTGLHMAVIGGRLDIVKLLLRHNAPLEVKNRYGGTVLGQTLWSGAHGADPEVTIAILEALVGAGAQVPDGHVPVNVRVDRWLAEHGCRAEPEWHWFGEKPHLVS